MLLSTSAIGIIGGADGPTAVYLTSKLFPLVGLALVGAGVVFGLLLYYLSHRS